jgi:hypothetical protein
MAALDPVVNDPGTDTEPIGDLSDGQFVGAFQTGGWNVIPIAGPTDYRASKPLALGAE